MDEKKNIFQKIIAAGEAQVDYMLLKSRARVNEMRPQKSDPVQKPIYDEDDDTFYQKSIYKDLTYSVGVSGFTEKTNKLSYYFLKQMAAKDAVVAAIIQTNQNKVASYSKRVDTKHERGFRISLKDEKQILRAIITSIKEDRDMKLKTKDHEWRADNYKKIIEGRNAMGTEQEEQDNKIRPRESEDVKNLYEKTETDRQFNEEQEEEILNDRELERIAKKILNDKIADRINAIENILLNCGYQDHRPFESKKWTFDAFLRAIVRDSLTYDQFAVEFIPDNFGKLHYFVPVDGGTIRYATIDLRNYRDFYQMPQDYNILNPEEEAPELLQRDTITLDEKKLENNEYKYVQIIDGRVQRAFTDQELALGMRNLTSDIWSNGYSISELELLLGIVSSHLFTENFNKQYFINGFSAKGFFHIKDKMPRRKLESIRVMMQHLIKGNRNSFQTPVMSGIEDIKWVPLNQNHSDMEFNLWMQYLIKVICAVYQIDPFEIGLGMREMGDGGGALSGDNSEIKLTHSKSKGFLPLMRFLEDFINKQVIDKIDSQFHFEWVGLEEESRQESIERQFKEVKYKKTVNEVREEDGLPPLPGMDDLILDPTYLAYYNMYSPAGKSRQEEMAEDQAQQRLQMRQQSPSFGENKDKKEENPYFKDKSSFKDKDSKFQPKHKKD